MRYQTTFITSFCLHMGILLYLIVSPRAQFRPPDKYIPISLVQNQVVQPEIEPEPPKPFVKKKPKVSEELIRDLQKRLKKKPTPKPTKPKPTPRPTKKRIPTKRPTKQPAATPTPMPTMPQNAIPLSELEKQFTPIPADREISSASARYQIKIIGMDATIESNRYANQLNNHLKSMWQQPRVRPPEPRDYVTVVSFTIQKEGQVSDFRIVVASGWSLMDRTVEQALKKASPVPPLPPTFPFGNIQVRVPFVFRQPK